MHVNVFQLQCMLVIAKCVTITTADPPQHLLCTNDKALLSTLQSSQKEPVYADLQHSTNSLIPVLPVGQVQYATVLSQTNKTESKVTGEPVYVDLHHSTNPPAAPLPAELNPVQYATQTNNTVTAQPESKEQRSHYADLTHSTNRPAPPLPAELNPVHYTTSPQVSSMMFVGLLNT